jgi:biopolymer transport protein ExbD
MSRRSHLHLPAFDDLQIDLSPMIDLVFLLLIFFMTSSTIITYLKDRRVELPVAEDAQAPVRGSARVVINVYADGTLGDERGNPLSRERLPSYFRQAQLRDPEVKVHVRPDRRVAHISVKQVLAAAKEVELYDVVFSAHPIDHPPPGESRKATE